MTSHFLILPLDQKPNVFDLGRTYPSENHAVQMLIWQGYSNVPQDPDYWGHDNRIISQADFDAETKEEPNPAQPVLDAIKAQVHQIRANALGPHLDTPIYDQLKREYDEKYSTLDYFETDLGKRLSHLHQNTPKFVG